MVVEKETEKTPVNSLAPGSGKVQDGQDSDIVVAASQVDWSAKEERRVVWK